MNFKFKNFSKENGYAHEFSSQTPQSNDASESKKKKS